ncbi:hypothetical protein CAK95_14130 [Pseudorhodoplanes sinuspersici]|uniref:Uncharacterized protein n=2 Tax=Pseudorhodoplanes sinuspersici TaxID=1235591 RepID=A0A1W6ZRS6_9HYPH|nr:hypothetical protein CAK95_14130 [Pseudorhodoplanes sinuspersici]
MRQGKTACKGRFIPMDRLDNLVVEHLADRLFNPERLSAILVTAATQRAEKAAEVDRLSACRGRRGR